MRPTVTSFFDPATYTYSYVVQDPASSACVIIDSVLDYDAASGALKQTVRKKSWPLCESISLQWSGF